MVTPSATIDRLPVAVCPLRCGNSLDPIAFHDIRRELMLHGCKWDPQIGDVNTLAPFPLLITRSSWLELADLAERLSAESLAAEKELQSQTKLRGKLGMPRRLRRLLDVASTHPHGESCSTVRTMRFDFHWTSVGWRISEINSDVPGGFSESSYFPALMARHYANTTTAGDSGAAWADAIARAAGEVRDVALLAAAGYLEDQQILAYLRELLGRRGITAHLASPLQIEPTPRGPYLKTNWYDGPVGMIVRFFQAEWLASLRGSSELLRYFCDRQTPVTNPMSSALTESKRFPLVWDELKTPLPTWRDLLMETRDPRHVRWWRDENWVLKTAYCNTGDDVAIAGLISAGQWQRIRAHVLISPWNWIAQRRFIAVPIDSDAGPIYPCIGVYTIDGRAAGAYGRFSSRPLIDFQAIDTAILIEEDHEPR